jgi:hypothetical protein
MVRWGRKESGSDHIHRTTLMQAGQTVHNLPRIVIRWSGWSQNKSADDPPPLSQLELLLLSSVKDEDWWPPDVSPHRHGFGLTL